MEEEEKCQLLLYCKTRFTRSRPSLSLSIFHIGVNSPFLSEEPLKLPEADDFIYDWIPSHTHAPISSHCQPAPLSCTGKEEEEEEGVYSVYTSSLR